MSVLHDYDKGRHSCYSLHLHIVFVTKYRKRIFGEIHAARLNEIFTELLPQHNASFVEGNTDQDHYHLLIKTTPKTPSIAVLVNSLKAVSSRRMRREFNDLAAAYKKNVLWSRSYFVGTCGGAPLETIKTYIEQQDGKS